MVERRDDPGSTGASDLKVLFPPPARGADPVVGLAPPGRDLVWAVYSRTSVDEEADRHGVERQARDGEAHLLRTGVPRHRIHHYVENDTSAWQKRRVQVFDEDGIARTVWRVVRPEWSRLRRDLREGVVNAVVVAHQDRLVRDPRDLQDAIDLVEDLGVTFTGLADDIDLATPAGRHRAQLMVWHAAASSEDASRRAALEHRRSARAGQTVGGPRPFGWDDDRVHLHAQESEHLRRWIVMALDGASWGRLVADASEHGVRGTRGARMTKASLRQVLLSPRNCGLRMFHGDFARDESGAPVLGVWEVVCSPAEYAALTQQFGPHPRMVTDPQVREREHQHLLIGLVRCGRCGASMRLVPRAGRRTDGSTAGLSSYACPAPSAGGCARVARSAHRVDASVLDAVRAWAADPVRTETGRRGQRSALDQLEAEIVAAQERRDDFLRAVATGRVPASTLEVLLPAVDEQVDALRHQHAERTSALARDTWVHAERFGDDRWERLTLDQQRRALRDVLDRVVVQPARRPYTTFDADAVEPVFRGG